MIRMLTDIWPENPNKLASGRAFLPERKIAPSFPERITFDFAFCISEYFHAADRSQDLII